MREWMPVTFGLLSIFPVKFSKPDSIQKSLTFAKVSYFIKYDWKGLLSPYFPLHTLTDPCHDHTYSYGHKHI